jgi:alkaline phosphatase
MGKVRFLAVWWVMLSIMAGCTGMTETRVDAFKPLITSETAAHEPAGEAPATAKYLILFIADGMSVENEIAGSRYLTGYDFGLVFHDDAKFPYRAFVSTWDITTYNRYAYSRSKPAFNQRAYTPTVGYDPALGGAKPFPLDSTGMDSYFLTKQAYSMTSRTAMPATDSASAATAMATGYKTEAGSISWLAGDPHAAGTRGSTGALRTVAERMRAEKGAAIGVVTTVSFAHATPAAFVSHNKSRSNYYTGYRGYTGTGIADEIINTTKPEVVIGAGHPVFSNPTWDTTKGAISKGLYTALKNSGEYVFVERQAGVNGAKSLEAAAATAARQNKKLFGLFGGMITRPDGAFYATDLFEPPVCANTPGNPSCSSGSNNENPVLKDLTTAAIKVLSTNSKGFFLMVEQGDMDWSNHANDYKWMIGSAWDLNEAVKAAFDYVNRPGDEMDWTNTLLIVTADHGTGYVRVFDDVRKTGKGVLPVQQQSGAAWRYPNGEVTYGTASHTNELVSLYATGCGHHLFRQYEGAWYPGTLIIDNTHIFHVMSQAAGLKLTGAP